MDHVVEFVNGLPSWIPVFICGWLAAALWRDVVLRWWVRRRWKKDIHTELERNGLSVEAIHWQGDLPHHIHIKPKEGMHDAD